ncbi:MAG: DUF5693 family protein [Firmicutes bacterium]|nr:DUF5693 family protein [Bacillota bacterium]
MFTERTARALLAGVVALGLVASPVSLALTGSLVPHPPVYQLAVPLRALQFLAAETGSDPAVVLQRLAAAGATAVIVEERYLGELSTLGGLAVVRGDRVREAESLLPGLGTWRAREPTVPVTLILTGDPEVAAWASEQARLRFGPERTAFFRGSAAGGPETLAVAVRGDLPPHTQLGFYPRDLALAAGSGLGLVLAVGTPWETTGLELTEALRPAEPYRDRTVAVFFNGADVWGLGAPGGPEEAGRELADLGLLFAANPDRRPRGLEELAAAAGWRGVAVQEVWTTGRPELYVEGVVERGAPLLVVMSAFFRRCAAEPDWAGEAAGALGSFVEGLEARGLEAGPLRPVEAGRPPLWLDVPAGWAALALAALAGLALIRRAGLTEAAAAGGRAAVLAAAAFGAVLVPFGLAGPGRVATVQGLAFLTSLAVPLLVLDLLLSWWQKACRGEGLALALRGAATVALGTTVGGLIVRALGTGPEFALKLELFRGVKVAALAGPAEAVALLWLATREGRRGLWAEMREGLRSLLRVRLTVGGVLLAAAAVVVAAYGLSRSGNQPLVPVSDLEFRVRRFLLDLFVVRPRTKEFLLGYPAWVVAASAAGRASGGTPRGFWAYALAAVIGILPSSVLNTFSHFHIPAVFSLARTALGLALGVAVGFVAAVLARWVGGHLSRLAAGRRSAGGARAGARARRALAAPAVLSLAAALVVAGVTGAETLPGVAGRRTVEVVVGLREVADLAAAGGGTVRDTLALLASRGLTSVALPETTVADLERAGAARVVRGVDLETVMLLGGADAVERRVAAAPGFDPAWTCVFLPPEAARRLVASAPGSPRLLLDSAGVGVVAWPGGPEEARSLRLGFWAPVVRARLEPVAGLGLRVAPVLCDFPDRDPERARAALEELRTVMGELGLEWSALVLEGPAVAGYPGQIPEVTGLAGGLGLVPALVAPTGADAGVAPGRPQASRGRPEPSRLGAAQAVSAADGRFLRVVAADLSDLPLSAPPIPDLPLPVTPSPDVVYVPLEGLASAEEAASLVAALAERADPSGVPAPGQARRYGTLPGWLLGPTGRGAVLGLVLVLLPGLAGALRPWEGRLFRGTRPVGAPAARRARVPVGRLAGITAAVVVAALGAFAVRALEADARVLLGLVSLDPWPGLPLAAALLATGLSRLPGLPRPSSPVSHRSDRWWSRPVTVRLLAGWSLVLAFAWVLPAAGPAGSLVGGLVALLAPAPEGSRPALWAYGVSALALAAGTPGFWPLS